MLGQLPPSEAIYLTTSQDSQNQTLDASTGHNYTVTFPLPVPADAFWSITLYNATNVQLVSNSINRYSIGDRVRPCLTIGTCVCALDANGNRKAELPCDISKT